MNNAANELEILEEVQAKLIETHERLGKMRVVLEQDYQELEKIQQRVVDGQLKNAELRQQLATRTKILVMLPQADENIKKLKVSWSYFLSIYIIGRGSLFLLLSSRFVHQTLKNFISSLLNGNRIDYHLFTKKPNCWQ